MTTQGLSEVVDGLTASLSLRSAWRNWYWATDGAVFL